jgi:hypothetical protein
MKLRDWFILLAAVCFWAMWTQYAYDRGYAAGSEAAVFDA